MSTPPPDLLGVQELRCEFLQNPLGIDVARPRLSWKLSSGRRGTLQSAYQLLVMDGEAELWDSGKVESDQSILVSYGGPTLKTGQRCRWQVRAWDNTGQISEWSEPAWWEMGLLETSDWQARWIEPGWDEDAAQSNPSPYLRAEFNLDRPILSARAYVTAHGLYELFLNGERVGDACYTPGYTSYDHRLQYQAHDVTGLLQNGENAIGAVLGDGWYRGAVSGVHIRNLYGKTLGLLLQLRVRYTDGTEQLILSGEGWKGATGPILKSDLQAGETYDARLEQPGWNKPGFDDSEWQSVKTAGYDLANLVATSGPFVKHKEHFTPVAILTTPNGETVVDMGQNFSGVVRLKVSGPAGTVVRLKHGETLDKNGNFTMAHLGLEGVLPPPEQEVTYILKDGGEEVYTPSFTTHGFRYVRVEGFPGTPTPDNFTGIAIYSDMAETGTFVSSNPLLNRLQHNILWSQKGNFLDIPTDCPTRERAGWTGDAEIFITTGSYLMDTAGFFTKWLKDVAAEQEPNGRIRNIVPTPDKGLPPGIGDLLKLVEGAAGWGDAVTIIPWTLYQVYGDIRILEEQYPSMRAWVEYQRNQARNKYAPGGYTPPKYRERKPRDHELYLWDTNFHWGEWLEPNDPVPALLFAGVKEESAPVISAPEVATAFFAYSAHLLAETAQVLGKTGEAGQYRELAGRVKAAYVTEFVGEDGRILPEKQSSYVRALAFDLIPANLRPVVAGRLAGLVRENGTHLGTGFLSTPFLCPVLGANGYLDLAYELLMQTTLPSWLYAVKKGATTIWESWDSIDEEGNPQNSLNHYSYGAIGNWLYRVVAGLEPAAPGYKHIRFQPQPGGGLTDVAATYQSPYGEIATRWQLENGRFLLNLTVPPNTTAAVVLPARLGQQVNENGQTLEEVEGVTGLKQTPEAIFVEIGSGAYCFSVA